MNFKKKGKKNRELTKKTSRRNRERKKQGWESRARTRKPAIPGLGETWRGNWRQRGASQSWTGNGVSRQFRFGLRNAISLQWLHYRLTWRFKMCGKQKYFFYMYVIDLDWTLKQESMALTWVEWEKSHNEMMALEVSPLRMKSLK